jgi:hypothetical protein
MEQYRMFELTFQGDEPQGSQAAVDLRVTFAWKDAAGNAAQKEVKGFYAGGGVFKARFLPETAGEYAWKAQGCVSGEGFCACEAAAAKKRGIVRASGIHFAYADGTPFMPVGTTIYALAHQERQLIEQTLETLKTAPFNKMRHCVFPKHYDYNNNEPELFAFEKDTDGSWDVNRPCIAFWERLEEILFALADVGIQSDLILFHPYDHWGFAKFTMEQNFIYLDYLLRRFAAIPEIWWSMANEFDLVFNKTIEDWYAIEDYITANDPFCHLLSTHNCFSFYDFTRPGITHCCVQTTQVESAAKWLKQYQKPLVYDECCYEGDLPQAWGNISAFAMVNRFWIANVQGAYATHGEVFLSDDEILWWSKGGRLKGQSPERLAFLRKTLEELPAPLEPWEVNPLEGLDPEFVKTIMSTPFMTLPAKMPEAQQESNLVKEGDARGRCGDEVFIQYLGRHCNRILNWKLPEDKKYRIDVIDVWEMTRRTAETGTSGKITVNLPAKEGIAVIAVRE